MAHAFDQKLRNKLLASVLITAAGILLALAVATFLITRAMLARQVVNTRRPARTASETWASSATRSGSDAAAEEILEGLRSARKPAA